MITAIAIITAWLLGMWFGYQIGTAEQHDDWD